jgi:hypothetical protein
MDCFRRHGIRTCCCALFHAPSHLHSTSHVTAHTAPNLASEAVSFVYHVVGRLEHNDCASRLPRCLSVRGVPRREHHGHAVWRQKQQRGQLRAVCAHARHVRAARAECGGELCYCRRVGRRTRHGNLFVGYFAKHLRTICSDRGAEARPREACRRVCVEHDAED